MDYQKMIESYTQWIIRWRYLVTLLILVLLAWVGSGVRFLEFAPDDRVFFSPDNPQLVALETLENTYTKGNDVLFVLAPKDGRIFTVEVLAAVEKLTRAAWQIPYSTRVDSITNFQHTQVFGDELVEGDLVEDAANLTPADIERIRQIAQNEPLLVNNVISPTGHVTGISVIVQLPGKNPEAEVPEVAKFVRQLTDNVLAENPDLEIYLFGGVMVDNAFAEASDQDMGQLLPIMFVILLIVLGVLLRTFSGMLIAMLIIFLSIIPAMGLAGWMGIKLTPVTSVAPHIILILAVADCIHIMSNFYHSMREGMDKRMAIVETFRINFTPVFLTSLTTAIGFLSLLFSESPPFQDFGYISAIGVSAAFLLTMTLLPALMFILPTKVRADHGWQYHTMIHFSEFVIRQRRFLLWGVMVLIIGLFAFIPRNELNNDFLKYFDETMEIRQATDFTAENLTGINYIEYSVESSGPNGINDPIFLGHLETFINWLRQQPEVVHVRSITDTMKRLNKNMHGGDPAWYHIPKTQELAAQMLLLHEMSLPYGLDLNDQLNVDKSATRVTVLMRGSTNNSISSNEILAFEQRVQVWLRDNVPLRMTGTGLDIIYAHLNHRIIRTMLFTIGTALVLISFILIFALRSLKIGLISLVPNLVPAAMAFGLWGLLVGQIGLAASAVVAMTLGIIVDDTIYFLNSYLYGRRKKGLNAADAVRYTFSTVGTALWVTSAVLIAGFSVLFLSHFHVNSTIGILVSIIVAFALLTDFLLLPALLMKIDDELSIKILILTDSVDNKFNDINPEGVKRE